MNRIQGAPLVDVRNNGVGDAVVAAWVVSSARALHRAVQVQAGHRRDVLELFGVSPDCVCDDERVDPGVRVDLAQYRTAPDDTRRRVAAFDVLCSALTLPRLRPVRPPYLEPAEAGRWADEQWAKVDPTGDRTRVLVFPEAAWHTRVWPLAYFIDLVEALSRDGHAVAAMAGTTQAVRHMPCAWWGGFPVAYAAAMCARADLVVGNESGPAHLAAAVGARAVPICGPTDAAIIYGHEPNVHPLQIARDVMPCVGCHFVHAHGYRHACDTGGCQALMRFDPASVAAGVRRILATTTSHRQGSAVRRPTPVQVLERSSSGQAQVGIGA